jgi:Uma2 family endonuclease
VESLQRIPMSWEEYLRTPEHPRVEWTDGVAVVSPAAGYRHQWISRRLANHLEAQLPGLFVYEAVNVRVAPRRIRIPDIVVMERSQTGVLVEDLPVLVVEILSPATRREDLVRKRNEYATAGIDQYWIVDADDEEASAVEVFRLVRRRYESLAVLDRERPTAEVRVGEHGVVPLDLTVLLDR